MILIATLSSLISVAPCAGYIVTPGAQYNFYSQVKTSLMRWSHVRIYTFSECLCISWNHWGEGALLTRDQDKIGRLIALN
jgi:hypothetical protein